MRMGRCAPAVHHPAIPKGGQRSSIRPSDLVVCTLSPAHRQEPRRTSQQPLITGDAGLRGAELLLLGELPVSTSSCSALSQHTWLQRRLQSNLCWPALTTQPQLPATATTGRVLLRVPGPHPPLGPQGTGLCPALQEQPREGDRGWLTCVTASVPWVPREGQQQHVPVFSSTHPRSAANTACLPGAAGKQPLHLLQRKLQELGSLPRRRGKSLCRAATFSHPCWETLIPVQPPGLCHLGTAAPASSRSSPCPSPVPTERGDKRAGCEELPQVQLSSDATSLGLRGEIHNVNMGSDNTAPAGSHTPLHPPCNYHGFNLALFIVLPWSFPFNEQSRSFLPVIITQLPILEVFCNGISGHKFYPPF